MACFERASPALKELLLRIYRADRPIEVDHHLHEFGSVQYHVKCSATNPNHAYLSISTPILSQGFMSSARLPHHTLQMVKGICPVVVEIIDPPREGFQLTLSLDFTKIPRKKVPAKIITEISSVQAVILSSQLKDILWNVNTQEISQGVYKPIKLVYHPREPFFVIRQQAKITVVLPMRFKDNTDVIIATAFFQELMDVGISGSYAKAPHCIWSPIPPPELRGEPIEDLSTNGGFVSFDITSRHVEGKKLDKTVWNILNFYTFVKYHVKSTRGFIQRRMRTRLESLVQLLQNAGTEADQQITRRKKSCKYVKKWVSTSKAKLLGRRHKITKKLKRIRSRLKIHGFSRLRRQWLTIPKFSSMTRYTKLE